MDKIHRNTNHGRLIFIYFFAFFGVIILMDSFFIYTAISTQTGVVTSQPYEKGLAYNAVLQRAKQQPVLGQSITFEKGVLRWVFDKPLDDASVTAHFYRPVQDGYDFNITLNDNGHGIYTAEPDIPLQGQWTIKLKAAWDDQTYHASTKIVAR